MPIYAARPPTLFPLGNQLMGLLGQESLQKSTAEMKREFLFLPVVKIGLQNFYEVEDLTLPEAGFEDGSFLAFTHSMIWASHSQGEFLELQFLGQIIKRSVPALRRALWGPGRDFYGTKTQSDHTIFMASPWRGIQTATQYVMVFMGNVLTERRIKIFWRYSGSS
ncbi:hypothetical protein GX48_08352 [Paracoccidioides brasiliensis]|nr:hypothetical protein GX48_08352 [Paracoccidioides brasiliensis]